MIDGAPQGRSPNREHTVHFYNDASDLCTSVARFLSDGLLAGLPAIAIATPDHSAAIQHALRAHAIDVARARHLGDLVLLDAEETLGTFMHDGMPDEALFTRHATQLIEQTLRGRGRTPIHAYGEMVDVLWQRGDRDAALRLEVLWNELQHTYNLSLLCGYAMANFRDGTSQREEVCRQHTHLIGRDMVPVALAHHLPFFA